jgi:hypothetical protein
MVIIDFPSAVESYPRLIAAMKLNKHITAPTKAMAVKVSQIIFLFFIYSISCQRRGSAPARQRLSAATWLSYFKFLPFAKDRESPE